MHVSRWLSGALLVGAVLFAPARGAGTDGATTGTVTGNLIHHYEFKALEGGMLTDSVAGNDLRAGETAAIKDEADAPGGKALVFDGSGTGLCVAKSGLEAGSGMIVEFGIKPPAAGEASQTVLQQPACWEFRYNSTRKMLDFIIWYPGDPKKYIAVSVAVTPDKWNAVKAVAGNGKIELHAGDKKAEKAIPADGGFASTNSAIRIGATGSKSRPYSGGIADLKISSF